MNVINIKAVLFPLNMVLDDILSEFPVMARFAVDEPLDLGHPVRSIHAVGSRLFVKHYLDLISVVHPDRKVQQIGLDVLLSEYGYFEVTDSQIFATTGRGYSLAAFDLKGKCLWEEESVGDVRSLATDGNTPYVLLFNHFGHNSGNFTVHALADHKLLPVEGLTFKRSQSSGDQRRGIVTDLTSAPGCVYVNWGDFGIPQRIQGLVAEHVDLPDNVQHTFTSAYQDNKGTIFLRSKYCTTYVDSEYGKLKTIDSCGVVGVDADLLYAIDRYYPSKIALGSNAMIRAYDKDTLDERGSVKVPYNVLEFQRVLSTPGMLWLYDTNSPLITPISITKGRFIPEGIAREIISAKE